MKATNIMNQQRGQQPHVATRKARVDAVRQAEVTALPLLKRETDPVLFTRRSGAFARMRSFIETIFYPEEQLERVTEDIKRKEASVKAQLERMEHDQQTYMAEMEIHHAHMEAARIELDKRIRQLEATLAEANISIANKDQIIELQKSLMEGRKQDHDLEMAKARITFMQQIKRIRMANASNGFSRYAIREAEVIAEARAEEESSKRNVKDLARVAHDLKNPLVVVSSAIGAIETEKLSSYSRNLLGMMKRNAKILEAMIEDILVANKLAHNAIELKREDYDIAQQLSEIVEGNQFNAEISRRKLVLLADPGLIVSADTIQIERALGNVISNALKFSKSIVTVTAKRTDAGVEISISDDGPGMDESVRKKVFSGKEMVTIDLINGNGFGLTNAKRIVDMHGGKITLESDIGKGSTFRIMLPASTAQEITAQETRK